MLELTEHLLSIIIYTAGRKARLPDHPEKMLTDSLTANRPERRPLTKSSPAGRRGSSPLEVHDGQDEDHRGARRRPAARLQHREVRTQLVRAGPRGRAGVPDRLQAGRGRGGAAARRVNQQKRRGSRRAAPLRVHPGCTSRSHRRRRRSAVDLSPP